MSAVLQIYLDNDFTATYQVERFTPSPTPAGYKPATGLTALRALLVSTLDATEAIHPTLDKVMVEDASTAFYHATFDGSDLTDHLSALVGQTIYLVLVHAQDLRIVQAAKVVAQRKATLV